MFRYPYRCQDRRRCTKKQLRSNDYYRLLGALYGRALSRQLDPDGRLYRHDYEDRDYVQSGSLFGLAGLGTSTSWLYDCLIMLTDEDLLIVRDSKIHRQALEYAITPEGVSCYRCFMERVVRMRLEMEHGCPIELRYLDDPSGFPDLEIA